MLDKIRAARRGNIAAKAGYTLSQRFLQYFFDRGLTPSNDDNFFFLKESSTMCTCLTGLHYLENIFEKYDHIYDISIMARSLTKDFLKEVCKKAGFSSDLMSATINRFESKLEFESSAWFLFLRSAFPNGFTNKEEVFKAAIGLYAARITVWSEFDSKLPFPENLEHWIERLVLSEIDKYKLLPELTARLKTFE